MHTLKGPPVKFECEDHDNTEPPTFMFCVNATIIDNESEANIVFFDEAMRQMLNMTCEELVNGQGFYDQHHIPDAISHIINVQKLMMVTIKPDLIAVNNIAAPLPISLSLTSDTPAKKQRLMIKEKSIGNCNLL